MKVKSKNLVGVIMGSKSDWVGTMEHCSDTLKKFGIKHDVKVISAHRTPKRLLKFLKEAKKNKMEVIIAAAGMSAHLAGVTASLTTIPVLGVPTESKLKGLDSLTFYSSNAKWYSSWNFSYRKSWSNKCCFACYFNLICKI